MPTQTDNIQDPPTMPPEDIHTDERTHAEAADLTLAERLERIRQARGYVQKQRIKNVGHTAVTHDNLLELIRPLFIMWGVRWKSVGCELMSDNVVQYEHDGKMTVIFTELLQWTFRFKRTEDPDFRHGHSVGMYDYEDVVVVSRGLDRQAKDAGGAMTYAEKYALMEIMNLGRGDDPDLTPVDLSPEIPEAVESRVRTIRGILDADEGVPDTDARLRDIAEGWGTHYGRKVASIYSLGPADLDRTIQQLTRNSEPPADPKGTTDLTPVTPPEDPPF